jgi:hypothetical protein
MAKYFSTPFAENGDKTPVPDETQPTGEVSYDSGYTFDYERPYDDPQYKDIEREKLNQLLFDITEAVGQMQQDGGAPQWFIIPGGYPRDSRVEHNGVIWTSTVNGNTAEPGAVGVTTWIQSGQTDPTIIAMAALTPLANQMIYFTGQDQAAVTAITSFGRQLLAAANGGDGLTALGVANATESIVGLIREATQNEVNTGANVDAAVKPYQLRSGFTFSVGNPTYIKAPDWLGGWILGCGSTAIAGNTTSPVNLTAIVPTAVRGVVATWATGTNGDQRSVFASPSGRNVSLRNPDGNAATCGYFFLAN